MPMSGAHFGLALGASLSSKGFTGSEMASFGGALGDGCVGALTGAPFTTTDTGSTSGAGAGTGTGLTGLVKATIVNAMLAEAVSVGFTITPESQDSYESVADAIIAELGVASLTSTHTPVFAGSGVVDIGSVIVSASTWKSIMTAIGISSGLLGAEWPTYCQVVAAGGVAGLVTATGMVTIAGSGGSPSPGAGVGSGAIS